jgi:hypothetical protein
MSDREQLRTCIATARRKIGEAEAELGPLTSGQRRDLLKDNFPWDGEVCDTIVRLIDEDDAARWRLRDQELSEAEKDDIYECLDMGNNKHDLILMYMETIGIEGQRGILQEIAEAKADCE